MSDKNAEPHSVAQAWAEASGAARPAPKKSKKKPHKKAMKPDVRRYVSVLVVLVVLLAVCFVGFWPLDQKITQGLDIKGGVSVIMTAEKPDGSDVTDTDMESAVAIVTNRVNSLGASEATVQRQGTNQILIQIPGATNAQEVIDTMGTTGTLEFVDLNDIADQDALAKINAGATGVKLEPGTYEAFMTGDQIESVTIGMQSSGSAYYAVNLHLDAQGTKAFGDVTRVLADTKSRIAILLDGVVQSAPAVQTAITNGDVSITGNYSLEEAKSFKTVLESGALPVTLEYSESSYVGPTLGQDSLMQGLVAVVVGFILILVYLFVFYQGMGLIYLGIFAALSSMGLFALSLSGLAGVVLTIGMAADSTILVLERFREELRAGKSVRTASISGSKHGIMTALDAGVVSLISALGLFFLTTGSARGFGLTLALGVLCSFFTLLMFTTPAIRLLGRGAVEKNPGFWGVKADMEEAKKPAASAVKGGEQDA